MPLKLMYITNRADVAQVAEAAGVDRIFVDMEYIGKSERQGGMNTVQNSHTVEDVRVIRNAMTKAQLLCRVNPIHEASAFYGSSREEIDSVIEAGADILMLPYFKTAREVETFAELVGGRARTMLLMETPEAVATADEILGVEGIDEIHIGLNDLSLGYGMKFMFELLTDGTVEKLCGKFRRKGIPYGFGGIAALGKGMLPSEYIIREHYRLGSTCAILSRSFCNTSKVEDIEEIKKIFANGLREIRALEAECAAADSVYFSENYKQMAEKIAVIREGIV